MPERIENQTRGRRSGLPAHRRAGPGHRQRGRCIHPHQSRRRNAENTTDPTRAQQHDPDPHPATPHLPSCSPALLVLVPFLGQGRGRRPRDTPPCWPGSIASSSYPVLAPLVRSSRSALHPPAISTPTTAAALSTPSDVALSLSLCPVSALQLQRPSAREGSKEGERKKRKKEKELLFFRRQARDYGGSAGLRAPDAAEVPCLDPCPARVETVLVLVPTGASAVSLED